MRLPIPFFTALAFGLLMAVPAVAQESAHAEDQRILTSAAMDDVLAGHESAVEQQRAQLARLLSLPQVQDLAHDRGIDMERVESAAAGLTADQMEEIAPLVSKAAPFVEDGLGSVTISVATIVIVLLVLILLT